ncbi:MAG: SGNH/GDSL hydrolase family protein [Ruminococcaceae bacterium]|nr:SGNH/GDSL hydrolase family protein [Oscillospiraceae bacterium]
MKAELCKGMIKMILTTEQLKEITLGALDIYTDENGDLCFKRFTDKQTEFYLKDHKDHVIRSKNTTGIRLAFYTDASALTLSYKMLRGLMANWFQFDITCDKAMIAHEHIVTEDDHCEGTFTTTLPEGEHLITIHFSNLCIFKLSGLELVNATFVRPHTPKGPKILFLGDSITHGATVDYPSLTYSARITAMTDAITLNQGVGGDIFRPGIIDPDISFDPEIVTIAFGTNDWSGARDNPTLRLARANKYFSEVQSAFPSAKIVYISPIWRNLTEEEYATFLPARKEFEALAKEKGIDVVDGFTLVPHLLPFYADGLHPNALGDSLYAENLAVALKKLGVI